MIEWISDKELRVLALAYQELAQLTKPQQNRVLKWLNDRIHSDQVRVTLANDDRQDEIDRQDGVLRDLEANAHDMIYPEPG